MRTDRIDDDIVEAVRDLEEIEDYLQSHDHELADNLSEVRVQLNEALIKGVIDSYE